MEATLGSTVKNMGMKVSSTVDEGFTLQDIVDFVNNAARLGSPMDSRVRVKVRNAFHTDGGLIRQITVEGNGEIP